MIYLGFRHSSGHSGEFFLRFAGSGMGCVNGHYHYDSREKGNLAGLCGVENECRGMVDRSCELTNGGT